MVSQVWSYSCNSTTLCPCTSSHTTEDVPTTITARDSLLSTSSLGFAKLASVADHYCKGGVEEVALGQEEVVYAWGRRVEQRFSSKHWIK